MSPPPSPMDGRSSLRLPSEFGWEDVVTDEAWASLGEDVKCELMELMLLHEESVAGRMRSAGGNPDHPPTASPIPGDDYKDPIESQTDSRLHGRHVAGAAKLKVDDGGSSAADKEEGKAKMMDPEMQEDRDLVNAHDSNLLSRDVRDSDTLVWLQTRITNLPETALLGPMRYTCCELGDTCLHNPSPMLQIFDVLVKCFMHDDIAGPYYLLPDDSLFPQLKMDVYGEVAIRDPLDHSRNYIFNRSRENAQTIYANGGYLRLRNPARAISAINCLIEIDLRIKAEVVEEDCTIVDGCVKAVGQFDPWRMNHVESMNGRVTFESCVLSKGVEATIELDFIEVPAGGFHVQMSGTTVLSKGFYSFINERCRDSDGFVTKKGKHMEKFVAAVSIGDVLHIDFMEKGRDSLPFVASKHGNEKQQYLFSNGAVVSVHVYWSTVGTLDSSIVGPVDTVPVRQ